VWTGFGDHRSCSGRFYGGQEMVHGEPRPGRGWRRPRPATGQERRWRSVCSRCTAFWIGVAVRGRLEKETQGVVAGWRAAVLDVH
jgi:hypothetical protein